MTERNAVRQYIQRAGSGVTKVGLAATLALSMTPALAIAKEAGNENAQEAAALTATNNDATAPKASKDAQTSSSTKQYSTDGTQVQSGDAEAQSNTSYSLAQIEDGTYVGTAVASEPSGEEWEIPSYTVKVEVTVASHAIKSVKVADETYNALGNGDSADYLDKAENGKRNVKGVAAQIVNKNATDVDVVSNATVSSKAIIEAVDNALQTAYDEQNAVESEYTYGFAAVPWSEYWSGEGVYNANDTSSSSEKDSHGEYDKGGYDVVTRATLNHGIKRVSFQSAMTIQSNEGKTFTVASWVQDQSTFTTADGETYTWHQPGRGESGDTTITASDGTIYTFKDFSIYGTKYVPVKVKAADLDAFKTAYTFYANDTQIQIGVNGEGAMAPYAATACVTDATNGLKEVTKSGDSFSFGAAKTGTDSGLKDTELKTIDLSSLGPQVYTSDDLGQFGEMMRVDFKGEGYGALGANMQSVTWTYYGSDSTRTNAVATYGTKFEADNWMHSKIGIQLGLTDSARCQFPEGTDGTGYWSLTIHALGYADSTYDFEATADNIKKTATPVSEETKAALQSAYDKAAALSEADYTAETWEKFAIERDEAKTLLSKEDLGESEASQQAKDLQDAIDTLDSYIYGYAGLTWSEYWAEEGVQAAGSSETSEMLDSRDESDKGAFDVVTRATTNHGLHRGSFQCTATIYTEEGQTFEVSAWDSTGNTFTTTSGEQVTKNTDRATDVTTLTCGDQTYTFKEYDVSGLKYVPVKVASSQLDAFKQAYQFVENGATLEGGYTEKNLKAYSVTAAVDATTNGLKTVEAGENGAFSFSAAAAGTGSGIEGQSQKVADLSAMGPVVKDGSGSFGEFLRVDFTENYGDLGANMQAVTWTYYGDDSTRTKAIATYGTKFAADNWMHKSQSIQLGLTDSLRCTLPEGTDGTGYWTITIRALGYADATYDFQATEDNIADHTLVTDATKAELQKLVDEASEKLSSIDESLYTEKSVSDLKTEYAETVEMLEKANLEESAALEQKTHLSEAIEGLALAPASEATIQKLEGLISDAEKLNGDDYTAASWQALCDVVAAAKQAASSDDLTEKDARAQVNALEEAASALVANPRIALNAAIDDAAALQQADYTKASWTAFAAALASAQAVAADDNATDDEVSAACQSLVNAKSSLAKAATTDDRDGLAAEIAKADSLKESDYTADSWKAYQAALAAAKKAAAAEDPSSAELQEASANLAAARAALAKPSSDASQANAGQSKAESTLAQTSDNAVAFAVAAAFASFAAAIAGAFAIARRRLSGK